MYVGDEPAVCAFVIKTTIPDNNSAVGNVCLGVDSFVFCEGAFLPETNHLRSRGKVPRVKTKGRYTSQVLYLILYVACAFPSRRPRRNR